MFRRARFSVKPNVRPNAAGRGGNSKGSTSSVAPAVATAASAAATTTDADGQHDSAPTTRSSTVEDSSMPHPGDAAASGDLHLSGDSSNNGSRNEKTSDKSGDGDCRKNVEGFPQRRKRISTMPNLIKPKIVPPPPSTVDLSSKCSQKQGPHSPAFGNPLLQKETSLPEKINLESSPKSSILPEKKTSAPQVPQFSPFKKSASKEPSPCIPAQRNDEALPKNTSSPLKERPTQETLMEEETTQTKSASADKKKICSDRVKIIKTQKLRKMLKEELNKEKKQRKCKYPIIEKNMPEDRSKMTMRDFIYYLPENNPMKSSFIEEKKTEKTSTMTQAKEPEERIVADHEDENEDDDDEEEQGEGGGGGEDDGSLLVPQVKVAEDGSIILDEESLTVEVLRTKGQCVVEENDPIFERGSTTTYSSFRKSYYTRPWSEKETDMFFLAISMVGTDFSMISQLFPHRARTEIKNKFKREEKVNGWRIDKAFKEKRPFDFSFFTKLLDKVLENERKKKDKDAACQQQKEKKSHKRNTPRSQKKRKDKVVNGQSNHSPGEHQDGRSSDMEIEVDAETAEKENEESPSILEQAKEQTVIESALTKKKRKRKKKDSEQETDNLLEERNIPTEMMEEKRTRKKRKNISANDEISGIGEVGDELEVPNRTIPDETLITDKEQLQCCIRLNEEAEKDHSIQKSKPGQEDVSSVTSEHHVEQHSVSQMNPKENIEDFEKSTEAQNEVAVIDKVDKNQNVVKKQTCGEEIMETDRAIPEKPTQEVQLQNFESDLTRASEKIEPLASNPLIVKVSSESLVENKAASISGFTTEETCNASSDVIRVTEESQKAFVGKMEVRGRWSRPKPNIGKVSGRKEASVEGELKKSGSDGAGGKEIEQNDTPSINPAEITETHCQGLDAEAANKNQSTSQESSKQTVLKPALLARGRLQRPKPNLGRVARRQELPGRSTETVKPSEAGTELVSEAVITETTVMQTECNDCQLLNNTTDATALEADTPQCAALEKRTVVSNEKVGGAYSNQSPVKKPGESESYTLQNASLSLDITKDVVIPASKDSSLQEEKKDNTVEIEHSLENSQSRCKKNLENASDREELLNRVQPQLDTAEKSESEYSETSNLSEAAKSKTLPSLEECPTNAQEEVATNETHLSLQNLPGLKNDASNEISLEPDTQKKELVGKQSSQEESKHSDTRSTPFLRGRFQRPKPNIGGIIGRKEKRSLEGNGLTNTGNLELQKSEPAKTPSTTQINDNLSDENLESSLEDAKKVIQKDSLVPSTGQNSSNLHLREKSNFQGDKSSTIKPAQLIRGRFQRAKFNVGRTNCKNEVPVSEDISVPIVEEVKEMEISKKDDLYLISEDEVIVQASPDNLDRKEGSESIESSSKRWIDQKKHPSEKSLECGLLKNQDDVKRKKLDALGSDTFDPQEINHSENKNTALLVKGHLQKVKPNVAQVPKNTESSLERENSKGDTGRDAECDTLYGSKFGKTAQLMGSLVHLVESASTSESRKEKKCIENIELASSTRSRHSGKHGSSDQPLENETQIKKEIPKLLSVQKKEVENLKGKQPGRTLKQRNKNYDSKTSSTSECENDHGRKMKHQQKVKQHVFRGRNLKPAPCKKSRNGNSKVNLVTLRASSQEEEEDDDEEEDEPESEYEAEIFSPEEVNKAPVFVPKGLRSPNPVPMHIEETMEELEIYENVADEPCISHDLNLSIQPAMQDDSKLYIPAVDITQEEQTKETGINDGSTEAAMTLLAMRDPVFQLYTDIQGNEVQMAVSSANEPIHSNNTNNMEGNSSKPLCSEECLEEKTVVLLPDSSKTLLVSPHKTNKTTTDLEKSSQETRVCSTVSLCKRNKTPRPARCRLPKPKPNLNSGSVSTRNVSQKPLNLSSDMEEYKEIQKVTDDKMSEKPREDQKVEMNLQMDEQLAKISTMGKYDLHSESAGPAMQENNMESGNLTQEISEIASELTSPKCSQEAVACLSEPPDNLNIKSNIHAFGSAEHKFSTAEVAQTEGNKNASILAMTEMSAVRGDITDFIDAEEEPEFILTLVEISPDSVECNNNPAVLAHGSGELLPPPILFTSDNMDSLELTRDECVGSIQASVEENAASVTDPIERELHPSSSEQLVDLGLTPWKNWKRSSISVEGSSASEKIRHTVPIEEHLESSDKGTSLKLQYISRKDAELQVEEKEQLQSSLNVGTALLCETDSEAELVSRMPDAGKAETNKEQRLCVAYSSEQSEQVRNTEALPKTSLPRSLGFLPLICKINTDEEIAAKENNRPPQKTCMLIFENTPECPASASKDSNTEIQEYSSLPTTMLSPSKYESGSCSSVQVLPEEEGSAKEQEKEEQIRISEYFFSDIFMEVDDSE